MRNLNEAEAAQIVGEIARERAAAGRPKLTQRQAAQILRAYRQVIELPTPITGDTTIRIPEPRPHGQPLVRG